MLISKFIEQESTKSYYQDLQATLQSEYQNFVVYPSYENLFTTFELCSKPKVVILGQDPYIHYGQAHGIAFSVYDAKLPPSLKNIYQELESDLGIVRQDGDLSNWCKQGVLLFNTIFTVRENQSLSHRNIGWEQFSENLVKYLDTQYDSLVFILWGGHAKKFKKFIKNGLVIEGVHPSPLSSYRGFFGSKPFSKCNQLLKDLGKSEVDWQ